MYLNFYEVNLMFRNIFIYEFEKFWSKKINILCFISIPLIILISLKFALDVNTTVNSKEVVFSSTMNFPILSLQETLITAFNVIIMIFFTLSFNEEYRKGNLRLAFTRAISIRKLYIAKVLVIAVNVFLMLLINFIICKVIGKIFLPSTNEVALFFKEGMYKNKDTIIYSLKYYFLAYLTLLAFGSIVEFFSIKCKTITAALGFSVGFLILNIIYMAAIMSLCSEKATLKYLSISTFYTQFAGTSYFAAGIGNVFIYEMLIVIIVFQLMCYRNFVSEDYLE